MSNDYVVGQSLFNNKHKRHHALKYQAVSLPNRLIQLRKGDMVVPFLQCQVCYKHFNSSHMVLMGKYSLYGVSAYPLKTHLLSPFDSTTKRLNECMSAAIGCLVKL